jgi:hypothetical protein
MADPRIAQTLRTIAQERVRILVGRMLNEQVGGRKTGLSPVEEAFVKAYYRPDRRLG